MPIDGTIVNQLDQGFGVQIKDIVTGATFLSELHRGGLMQDGRALGSSIANSMIQSDTPGQGMNLKFADVTPRSPGQAQEATPSAPAGKPA